MPKLNISSSTTSSVHGWIDEWREYVESGDSTMTDFSTWCSTNGIHKNVIKDAPKVERVMTRESEDRMASIKKRVAVLVNGDIDVAIYHQFPFSPNKNKFDLSYPIMDANGRYFDTIWEDWLYDKLYEDVACQITILGEL